MLTQQKAGRIWYVAALLTGLLLLVDSALPALAHDNSPNARGIPPSRLAQFKAAGHLVAFESDRVRPAAVDYLLSVEFVEGRAIPQMNAGAHAPRLPLIVDPKYSWHSFYGSDWYDGGRQIAADQSGNVYVVGESTKTWQGDGATEPKRPHGGGGYYDMFVVKLDRSGVYQWHTFYGSGLNDMAFGVAVDGNGNVYVAGESWAAWQGDGAKPPKHAYAGGGSADIVVVKLDSNGVYQWHTFYGSGTVDTGYSVVAVGNGDVYVTGKSAAAWLGDENKLPKHTHSGSSDIVVLKLNSSGTYQWHTFYGAGGVDEGMGITADASSNVYVTGYSSSAWQGDENTDPKHTFGGETDIVVLKLNSSGTYQWHTFYGSNGRDQSAGIVADASGNVYVTGNSMDASWKGSGGENPKHPFSGYNDLVVLKLNSTGAYQWHAFYGSTGNDSGAGIALDAAGGVYVAGSSDVSWKGDNNADPKHSFGGSADIVVLKLNSNGAYQWHCYEPN